VVSELAVIKLGGSVITNKDVPLSLNELAINRILNAISKIKIPIVLVHGGGSFGHYWSIRFNMHSKPDNYSPYGISVVHQSMVHLNDFIVNSMMRKKMCPYSIAPLSFMDNDKINKMQILNLGKIAKSKMIPITFGDVIYRYRMKYSVISGDEIMTIISSVLRPTKIVFALNVDGVYKDLETREMIETFEKDEVKFSRVKSDITGGMHRKVREALKISTMGLDVHILNGLKPERIVDLIENNKFKGTVIRGKKINT
jgi:isopentenyl phosphate kinase